jgi:hypothetical protein
MGTIVSIEIVEPPASAPMRADADAAIERAFEWFREVERAAAGSTRPASCDSYRASRAGRSASVKSCFRPPSSTDGGRGNGWRLRPTIGRQMEARGFDRHYLTGRAVTFARGGDAAIAMSSSIRSNAPLRCGGRSCSTSAPWPKAWRSISRLGSSRRFGFRDRRGRRLRRRRNGSGDLWNVGIRHPRNQVRRSTCCGFRQAVCTSGDYERTTAHGHHILDPRDGRSADAIAAPGGGAHGLLADALATAAFVLGPPTASTCSNATASAACCCRVLERFVTGGFCVTSSERLKGS